MKAVIALLALGLASCASAGKPAIVYQPVVKPVAVSCVPKGTDLAPPKIHSDAELRATDGPQRYLWTSADRKAAMAWVALAEPVLKGCS